MSCEDIDNLTFSHNKLAELLDNVSDCNERDKIVKDFIKSINTSAILDFPKGLEWFNVLEPLSFHKQLKGKLVLLDFFTYCCINCMHILPDLKEIEEEFPVEKGLVVIGVHSAKFDNEKISNNILAAVQRYNISHPVVNDTDAFMWNNCGINCWPTLLLIGPKGNPLVMLMGEGHKDDLHLYIRNALDYYKTQNEISEHKLPLQSSFYLLPELKGPLLFPGKIANYVDADNNNIEYFAVSDTGNHRILIISPEGVILQQIGNICGFKDGSFPEARFNSPQGLVFQNEHILYVCDTENHAIRKINLKLKNVETVAGTGHQGIDRIGGKVGIQQEISSPWDVCIFKTPDMDMSFHLPNEQVTQKDVLIIAMAGTHQIWALFLDDIVWWKFKRYTKGTCVFIAGSGKEENRNNSYPHAAAFAQPSGLALCNETKEVYIADSESSSVRRLSLIDGKVSAVVGGDKSPTNLFGFGDLDGKLYEAKLQHPIGLSTYKNQQIFVADTYNHKIKLININTNTIKTLDIPHENNADNMLNEPCGICLNKDGNKLYVCDTNNHSIKIIHLAAAAATLTPPNHDDRIEKITKLDLRVSDKQESLVVKKFKTIVPYGKIFSINETGGKIILHVNTNFTNGYSLTIDAPLKWLVILPNETWSCVPHYGYNVDSFDSIISVPKYVNSKEKFYVEFNFAVCKENMCLPKNFAVEFSIEFAKHGVGQINEIVQVNVGADITCNQ